MRIKWFLILTLCILNSALAIAQEQRTRNPFLDAPDTGWQTVTMPDSNGVVMYNRASIVEGAKYKDCKGVVIINTTLNSIIRLLEDTGVSHLWMYNCVGAEKVSEDDTKKESIKRFKTEKKVPFFPTAKYDSVVRDTRSQDITTKVVTISITSAHDLIPKDTEYNRIERLYGKWELHPSKNGVKVIYELYSEPSGLGVEIADVFGGVEPGLRKNMLETLKGMKEVLECRRDNQCKHRFDCQKYKEGKEYVKETE